MGWTQESVFCQLKHHQCLLAGNGWKLVEKVCKAVACFQKIDERFDGYSCAFENGRAAQNFIRPFTLRQISVTEL